MATLLDPTERRLGHGDLAVDADHPGLDLLTQQVTLRDERRKRVCGQAIGQPVRLLDGGIEVGEGIQISATGPNGSSFMMRALFGTSEMTVGCQK